LNTIDDTVSIGRSYFVEYIGGFDEFD